MDDVKGIVQEKYGAAARRVTQGEENACCGASACCDNNDPITGDLYSAEQASEIPEEAVRASLGCGNPTALAELKAGETVLDLGSGGGRTSPRKDCLRRSSRLGIHFRQPDSVLRRRPERVANCVLRID